MITKASYLYHPNSGMVDIVFYQAGDAVAFITCNFNDFSVSRSSQTNLYWFRHFTVGSSSSLKISKRVFDYLNQMIAAHPNQDEIPF